MLSHQEVLIQNRSLVSHSRVEALRKRREALKKRDSVRFAPGVPAAHWCPAAPQSAGSLGMASM